MKPIHLIYAFILLFVLLGTLTVLDHRHLLDDAPAPILGECYRSEPWKDDPFFPRVIARVTAVKDGYVQCEIRYGDNSDWSYKKPVLSMTEFHRMFKVRVPNPETATARQ